MNNPAQVVDLTERWYPNPIGTEPDAHANAQIRLDQAWRALVAEVPGLPSAIAAGSVDEYAVIDVVCAATQRVMANPEGYTDGSESIDDYSRSWKYGATASTDLYFTAAELRRMGSNAGSSAFTIRPR